jgi:hypothetical protein
MRTNTPREQRYLAKVDRRGPDECWPWTASRNTFGYGTFKGDVVNGKQEQLAHRYGYRLLVGPIPDGMHVCHSCDTPPCQNPAHWFVGTHADNHADKVRKGRQSRVRFSGEANPHAKLTAADVAAIRERCAAGETQESVAQDFGVQQPAISRIIRGARWAQVEHP